MSIPVPENSLKIDEICKSISRYEGNIVGLRKHGQELIPTIPSTKDQILQALSEVEKQWANLDNMRRSSEKQITNSVQAWSLKRIFFQLRTFLATAKKVNLTL